MHGLVDPIAIFKKKNTGERKKNNEPQTKSLHMHNTERKSEEKK